MDNNTTHNTTVTIVNKKYKIIISSQNVDAYITNQSRAFSPPITLIKLIQLFPKIHVQSIKETTFFSDNNEYE